MKKIILSIAMLGIFTASAFAETSTTYTVLGQRTGPVTAGPGGVSANCDDDTYKNCFTVTVTLSENEQVPERGNPTVVNTYGSDGQPDGNTYSGGWVSMEKVPNGNLTTYTVALTNLRQN